MSIASRPKVTVYVPCHNYAHYLQQALDSVYAQLLTNWELIIIDDGSNDDTREILDDNQSRFPGQVTFIHNDIPQGLLSCANMALERASGEYIMRLDADDFLDESALLVLAGYLDANLDTALVYPNYYYVDENGLFLGIENRKKVNSKSKLLDLPAHGACTMVRRRTLKSVGGYSEKSKSQDGYELWLKIARRYKVANVTTPLFHYRQHGSSLSSNQKNLLESRQKIKRALAQVSEGQVSPRITAILPIKNTYPDHPNIALRQIGGKTLVDYAVGSAIESKFFDTILVTTDDPAVVAYCQKWPEVIVNLRPKKLSYQDRRLAHVIHDGVLQLETTHKNFPDIIAVLNLHTPLRKSTHIIKALDTLLLYDSDSVVSVTEDWTTHYIHKENGLEPLNPAMMDQIRLEKEAIFSDNGAIKVMWRDTISKDSLLGARISHVLMTPEDSVIASTEVNIHLIEYLLEKRRNT